MNNRSRPSPAVQMRTSLAVSRQHGVQFDLAWKKAWRNVKWPHDTIHRREWKAVLLEGKEMWRGSYDRDRSIVALRLEHQFTALEIAVA